MFVKFEPGEFLEKQELERFRKSLDEKGFREFLLDNTLKFGLIDKQYFNETRVVQDQFENGQVFETAGLTIAHKEIEAINKDGLVIYRKETTNISVPADSQWYWVKIKHQYTPRELGTFSIDDKGNLVGTGTAELLTILRGQPYFPSRVRFSNAVNNTLEYDVLEVVDDQNAVLQGYFTPETGLELVVVGTFAPDVTPTAAQKDIFQYDDCQLSLVLETSTNVAPTKLVGEEFYLARVKNDGVAVFIQDKRIELWKTKANFYLHNVDKTVNNLFGVENIKFDHGNSTRDYNIIEIGWGMRSANWSVDAKLNTLTLSGGNGGRYKDVSYPNTGDFDGWLVYWPDGSFSNVVSSTQNGSQVNLLLDQLDIDKVSPNGGVTFNAVELVVVPNAEEIEIELVPWTDGDADLAQPEADMPTTAHQLYSFPIADQRGECRALVFAETVQFGIRYRYRKNNEYSAKLDMLGDTQFGHYTEKSFDGNGYLLPAVASASYAANLVAGNIKTYGDLKVFLNLKSDAYINQIESIDLGDLLGVETRAIATTPNDVTLTVGVDRQYQYVNGSQFTLNDNKRIVLADGLRNGNFFIIHVKQVLILQGNSFSIVDSTFSTLKNFDSYDENQLKTSTEGIFIKCTWDGLKWILNSVDERNVLDPTTLAHWDTLVSGTVALRYLNDFSGGLQAAPFTFPVESYDRIISVTTSGTGITDFDTQGFTESGIGTGIYHRVARILGYGGAIITVPAGCRFQLTIEDPSGPGIGGATWTIHKFRG